ncbi:MAG: glycoside hydrolase family 113 [Chthonomonadales bacterium]
MRSHNSILAGLARWVTIAVVASPLSSLQAPCSARSNPVVFQKGFSFAAWTADGFLGKASDDQLAAMKRGGVQWVSIVTLWQQATPASTVIAPAPLWTSTDESLRHVIREAHRIGLKVMLKPQIDLAGPGWRGEITFTKEEDWQAWFASYRRFIEYHADLAASEKAELFCVGVELDGTRHREADWRQVVSSVRKRYKGPLTYAANWNRETDIAWWDALDYVGVDAYYPLADRPGRSVEDLKAAWRPYVQRLRDLSARVRKPILFTEIGYRSSIRAAMEPWEWALPQPVSLDEQARLYRAALDTFWDEPWFAGAYWWLWEVRDVPDAHADTGYSVRGKPAWDIVKAFYAKLRKAPTPPTR